LGKRGSGAGEKPLALSAKRGENEALMLPRIALRRALIKKEVG